jgi:hypothetical protein
VTLASQAFITIPYLYQRVIIRFVQPMIFSGVCMVWYMAKKSKPALIVLAFASLASAAYVVRQWQVSKHASVRTLSAIAPSSVELASEGAVPTFINYDPSADADDSDLSGSEASDGNVSSSSANGDSSSGEENRVRAVRKPGKTPKSSPSRSVARRIGSTASDPMNYRPAGCSQSGDDDETPLHMPSRSISKRDLGNTLAGEMRTASSEGQRAKDKCAPALEEVSSSDGWRISFSNSSEDADDRQETRVPAISVHIIQPGRQRVESYYSADDMSIALSSEPSNLDSNRQKNREVSVESERLSLSSATSSQWSVSDMTAEE